MKTVKLGEYIRTISPKTKIQAKKFLSAGRYPVVSQEAGLINGYWDEIDDVMHFDKPVIVYGDHTRVVKFIDFDFVSGADGTKILITPDDLDSRYFYHWLLAHPTKHLGYARHFRLLKELEIEVPSLEEQRRIVARLDAAFEKISAAEVLMRRNLDNVAALQKSILHKYLSASDSTHTHRLGDYLQKTFNIKWQERINQSFEYIDLTSVDRLSHTITKTTKINASNAPSRAKKIVNTGDVIFGTTRPTLNRLSIINDEYDNQICSTGFCVLRGNDEIKPGYIYYLLNTPEFNSFIESRQRGTSYPAVTDSDVKDYRVHIPPKSVQIETVSKLDNALSKTRKLESQYQKKLEKLTDLRQSLLSEAFMTTSEV